MKTHNFLAPQCKIKSASCGRRKSALCALAQLCMKECVSLLYTVFILPKQLTAWPAITHFENRAWDLSANLHFSSFRNTGLPTVLFCGYSPSSLIYKITINMKDKVQVCPHFITPRWELSHTKTIKLYVSFYVELLLLMLSFNTFLIFVSFSYYQKCEESFIKWRVKLHSSWKSQTKIVRGTQSWKPIWAWNVFTAAVCKVTRSACIWT
jgi:hypothetical protein